MSLYRAYFVPGGVDPLGLDTKHWIIDGGVAGLLKTELWIKNDPVNGVNCSFDAFDTNVIFNAGGVGLSVFKVGIKNTFEIEKLDDLDTITDDGCDCSCGSKGDLYSKTVRRNIYRRWTIGVELGRSIIGTYAVSYTHLTLPTKRIV